MGFFSKLKQNLSHGGIKLEIQVPSSVSEQDASFTAQVTVINGGTTPQTIKQVKVAVIEDHTMQQSQNNETPQPNREVTSSVESSPFIVQAGETKTLAVSVPLNLGKYMNQEMPDNAVIDAAANVLSRFQSVAETIQTKNYAHFVQVTADVDGVTLDPSARSPIQLLKPGQIGTSMNIKL